MMQVSAFGPSGSAVPLGKAISLEIKMDLDVPADTFQGTFLATQEPGEIAKIKVADDGGTTLFFQGPVDEQIFEAGPLGKTVTLAARSMAALLLDNETASKSYESPWLNTIFADHAAPYGIASFEGNPFRGPSRFEARLGEREWNVILNFFIKSFWEAPRITPDNILHTSGYPIFSLPEIPLGDRMAGEPACICARHILRRKSPLEKIQFISPTGQPDTLLENDPAISRGIRRQRYLMFERSVLELVDRGYLMINQSNRMADLLFIRCLGDLPVVAGQVVRLKDPTLGTVSGYTVYRLRHRSDSSGRMTDLTCVKFE